MTIGNDGISFKRNNSDVKAKNGLLIAQDNSVLPPGKKVQVRQSDNSIKEYNINSKEYEDLYNSGHLVNYDKNTDTYIATSLPEVTISAEKPEWLQRVEKQNEFIKNNYKEEYPYAIIDKKRNKLFLYGADNKLLKEEQMITGQNNKDADYSISMKDWLKDNEGKSHEDYFDYLATTENKVTPAGHFTIGTLRDEVYDNPDKVGDFWNSLFNKERREQILNNRKRDYGSQGKLLTLIDDAGVASSKAIHGTDNPVRESVLNEPSEYAERDLSNGCINVGDNSICFDTLKKGSSVYILPEESPELVTVHNKKMSNGNFIKKSKSKIYNALKIKGVEPNDELINKISTIHGKESEWGLSKYLPIDNIIGKSKGEFQINPKSFSKYLDEDYDGSFNSQVKAVYNFLKANSDTEDIHELYATYNSGKEGLTTANDMRRTLEKIYQNVKLIK